LLHHLLILKQKRTPGKLSKNSKKKHVKSQLTIEKKSSLKIVKETKKQIVKK